jgi:EAL domain-containing protein (putative c-di-GMP-specific phosphodiesterase class I)
VRAVVSLARGFGQRTIAEGVEDSDTMDLLRELGVDCAQGFAIARPAPVADVLGSV